MQPLYTRQESTEDGIITQTQWGYCREQNAVRLGYCANILVALVGLILVAWLSKTGLWICALVGASFGCAYVAEQLWPSLLQVYVMVGSIAFTVSAYLVMLALAFWG